MASLSEISIKNNRLSDITGICNSVRELHLEDNELGSSWDVNSNVMSTLENLEVLDLSLNQINVLDAGLFAKMLQLQRLYLNFNSVDSFPGGLFVNNKNLKILSIAHN